MSNNKNIFIFFNLLFLNDFYFFINELFFLIYLLVILMFGVVWSNNKNFMFNKYLIINKILCYNFIFFIFIFIVLLYNLEIFNYSIFNNMYIMNNFIYFMKYFLIFFILLFIFLLKFILDIFKIDFEFIFILIFSFFSLFLLFSVNNLIVLYLSFELFNLCLYILISYKQDSNFSTEAGLKYFIVSSVSSGFLLFGISIIYGITGLLNYNDIILFINTIDFMYNDLYLLLLLSFLFLFTAFLIKLSVVPFHFWAVDVYYGCNIIIMFFMMIFTKIINLFLLIILLFLLFSNLYYYWSIIIYILNIMCLFIGIFGALYQTKIRKILIYSMISNTGFFLACFLINNIEGLHLLLFYLFNYLFINIGIFICLLNLQDKMNNFNDNIYNLTNLININPLLSWLLAILLFSLGGLPPLLGFYNKFYLFSLLVKNDFLFLVIFNMLMSVISFFYYLRIIKIIFFNKNYYWFNLNNLNLTLSLILLFIILFNLFFFIYPTPIILLFFKFSFFFFFLNLFIIIIYF